MRKEFKKKRRKEWASGVVFLFVCMFLNNFGKGYMQRCEVDMKRLGGEWYWGIQCEISKE